MVDSNHYLIGLSYDGSGFYGWARQPNNRTIQGEIEDKLSLILKRKISILSSSRTDKGVHAIEQNFVFKSEINFQCGHLLRMMRNLTIDGIQIRKVTRVKNSFHPIRDVKEKEYRYFINTGRKNIFYRQYRWEYGSKLEVKKLNKILEIFLGEHDFSNFSSEKLFKKVSQKREIKLIKCFKRNGIVTIRVISKGFMRYQIRAMIGEAINCYEGKIEAKEIKERLDDGSSKKNKYKKIAPPFGLYLWKISYY